METKKVFTVEEVTAMLNGNVTEESLSALSAIISDKKAAKAAAEKAAAKVKAEEEAKLAAEKLLREYEATVKENFARILKDVKATKAENWEEYKQAVLDSLNSMPKPPAAKKVAKAGKGTSHARKEGGVIATIEKLITDSGEAGITKEDIHAGLVIAFPERDADSMLTTINAQVPSKLKERDCIVERLESGAYHRVN